MSEFNPYRAPDAPLPTGKVLGEQGLWREGKLLLAAKGTEFPDRCIKCNAPAEGYRLKRTLYWHPGWYYLTLLINLIVYAIVAMIVRKTAKLAVPLCPRHRSARTRDILIAWVGSLAAIGLIVALIGYRESLPQSMTGPTILVAVVLVLVSIIYGATRARIIVPKRINDYMAWVKGASPEFLATLPDASMPAGDPWLASEKPHGHKPESLEIVEDFKEM